MWCPSCRQDVPGVPGTVDSRFGCPRCGTLLAVDAGIDLATAAATESPPLADDGAAKPGRSTRVGSSEESPDFEPVTAPRGEPIRISSLRWDAANWELNEKLRHVERVTATARRRFDAPHSSPAAADTERCEAMPSPYAPPTYSPQSIPAHPQSPYSPAYAPTGPYTPETPAPLGPHEPAPFEWNRSSSGMAEAMATLVSWFFLGVAVTAFSCGGFLAAWGAVAERPALEQLGTPFLLGGMISLLLGVLPQAYLRKARDEQTRREAWSAELDRRTPRGPHYRRQHSPQRTYHRSEA